MEQPESSEKPIFRAEAIAAAGGGNRLNTLSPIISPRLWILTAALALMLAAIVAWGVLGKIPTTVIGSGIFLRGERLDAVHVLDGGYVSEIRVREGDRVSKGGCVAIISTGKSQSDGAPTQVLSPFEGRVVSIEAEVGDYLEAGRVISILSSGELAPTCIAFVALSEGKAIVKGMPARVTFATADAQAGAHVTGHVSHVDGFITSAERMLGRIPSASVVEAIRQQYGSVMAVTVAMDGDVNGAGGVHWSSGGGSKELLIDGAPCDIEVTIGEIRPVALIVPGIDAGTSGP